MSSYDAGGFSRLARRQRLNRRPFKPVARSSQGAADCSLAKPALEFTNRVIPLLIEYRDRVENMCLTISSKRTKRSIFNHNEQGWRLFASSVSQHIEHAEICDGQKVELSLRLREFEAAIERLKEST